MGDDSMTGFKGDDSNIGFSGEDSIIGQSDDDSTNGSSLEYLFGSIGNQSSTSETSSGSIEKFRARGSSLVS